MITKFNAIVLCIAITVVSVNVAFSQETDNEIDRFNNHRFAFLNYRGIHAIDVASGSAMVKGDYPDAKFAVYFKLGYKVHFTSHLNLNVIFNRYNLVIKDKFDESFMSVDLNWEFLLRPYRRFSPFVYVGGGYYTTNYMDTTATKAQGGVGFEYILKEGIGLKLFGEYNSIFPDERNGRINEKADDGLLRMGLGLNIYFGGNKKKEALRKKLKTVINCNPILPYNKSQFLLLPKKNLTLFDE